MGHGQYLNPKWMWMDWQKNKRFWPKFSISWLIPVWTHRWLLNNAQILKWHRRGAYCFLRSSLKFLGHTGRKIDNFDLNWAISGLLTPVWIHRWLRNDAQCLKWVGVGGLSEVVATFNHVGRSFNLFMATGDVWIIPSCQIWDYVLHVEHVSCVVINCGKQQWVIPSLSTAL